MGDKAKGFYARWITTRIMSILLFTSFQSFYAVRSFTSMESMMGKLR